MNSFIGWIGGKRALRSAILERFPAEPPSRYIEVFGGAAWVLFAKEPKSEQLEVYNDRDGKLVNLFRCVKYHAEELQRELACLLTSREQFLDFKSQLTAEGLTDIQRAARFFYLIKISFGSDHRTYATSAKTVDRASDYLAAVKERLRNVNIENKDFSDLMRVYDRPSALFYVDPPYVGTESYYDAAFHKEDHVRLRDALAQTKGKFLLSYNDHPLLWELYEGYHIERISRPSTLAGQENTNPYHELLIRNYELPGGAV